MINMNINDLTPIDEYNGYLRKRDDLFTIDGISGGKVRQCYNLVKDNLEHIKKDCLSTIITAAGLPSPQSTIVACVAKHFGLKCIVSVPKYDNDKIDYNRINVSIAQKFGANIYGVNNTNLSGPEKDVEMMCKQYNYFRVKFGMNGKSVMDTISHQVQNIPTSVKNVVCIAGSGLSALGIMKGLGVYNKSVENIHIVALSDYFSLNKKKWYDVLPNEQKFNGEVYIHKSDIPYQTFHQIDNGFEFDLTYESKAWQWMIDNIPPSNETLFWMVGVKNYDLSNIENINWKKSFYETELDKKRIKYESIKHNFFK
jgi:1-aminocyclopropane-1-carboxylate deaminase/D-cysteine desulfhydrase-like pyridoxal-dependent ACC family enzyme